MIRLERMRWWHLDGVLALERAAFAPEDWSAETWWGELVPDRERFLLVALDEDDAVQGFAGLARVDEDGHVMTIAVAASARGTGLGQRLLGALLREADRKGLHRVGLEVREGNAVAQSLYVKAGFVPFGRRPRYYPTTGEAAILMRCDDPGLGATLLGC